MVHSGYIELSAGLLTPRPLADARDDGFDTLQVQAIPTRRRVQLSTPAPSSARDQRTVFRFGAYRFDSRSLELSRGKQAIPLALKPAQMLLCLIEHAPELATRQALQDRIWTDGTVVEFEQGINACVRQLRVALKDSAHTPEYIQTLPKRGYRLIPEVRAVSNSRTRKLSLWAVAVLAAAIVPLSWLWPTASDPRVPRLYVPPVQIEGELQEQTRYLVEHALRLATIERLGRASNSAMEVVNGESIWRDGVMSALDSDSDFSLQLVIAADDHSQTLNASLRRGSTAELVAEQRTALSELSPSQMHIHAERLAHWAALQISASELGEWTTPYSENPQVLEALLRARQMRQVGQLKSMNESLSWYQRALEIDPNSVEARGGKALSLAMLAGSPKHPTAQTYDQAMAIAETLNAEVGAQVDAEVAIAFIKLYRDWDFPAAQSAVNRALIASPSDARAHAMRAAVLGALGDAEGALREASTAVRLDPLAMSINGDRCIYLVYASHYADAEQACGWILQQAPGNYWSRIGLATAQHRMQQIDQAVETLQPIVNSLQLQLAQPEAGPNTYAATLCAIADGLVDRAEQNQFPSYEIAAMYSECGRSAQSEQWLERARSGGESSALFQAIDPRFAGD